MARHLSGFPTVLDESPPLHVDLALTRANALAAAILDAPARTPSAIWAKAAVLAWDIEGEDADGFVMDGFRAAGLRSLLDGVHTVLRD